MKMLTVVGARPQFVKAAVVSRAVRRHNAAGAGEAIHEVLLHTGQHYDLSMSEVFFRELGIAAPDHQLEINNLPHGAMTGRMLEKIEAVMLVEKPDLVLVYGDTNSTLAAALAAAKQNIPLAHVEAGLRSRNRRMPEEINRVLTDHAADLLFCPTAAAVENLAAEGITAGVYRVGDVMLDAFEYYRQLAGKKSSVLRDLRLVPGSYLLATVHRAENTDDPARLAAILAAFDDLCRAAGAEPRIVHIPRERILKAGGDVMGPKNLYFGVYYDLPSITQRIDKARRLLGFEPMDFLAGLRETFTWYQQHHRRPATDYSFEDLLLQAQTDC